jgi:hypothetical protein
VGVDASVARTHAIVAERQMGSSSSSSWKRMIYEVSKNRPAKEDDRLFARPANRPAYGLAKAPQALNNLRSRSGSQTGTGAEQLLLPAVVLGSVRRMPKSGVRYSAA